MNKRKKGFGLLCVFIALVISSTYFILKCEGYIDKMSPEETLEAFYNSILDGDESRFRKCIDKDSFQKINMESYLYADAFVTGYEIIERDIHGKRARLEVKEEITGYDMKKKNIKVSYTMKLARGNWKIIDIMYDEQQGS